MHAVFVFGTLKSDFPNAEFNHGSRVAGQFVTRDRYPLYLVGERYSPWLVHAPGKGFQVRGQVYMVDDAGLEQMDRLERVQAADGYDRVRLAVIAETTNTEKQVFVYIKSVQQLEAARVRLGPFAEYELSHAALYQRRSQ